MADMTLTPLGGKFDLAGSLQQTLSFLISQAVMTAWAGDMQFE